MAKTTTRTNPRLVSAKPKADDDNALGAYAEALGSAMGQLRNRVDDWKGQRSHLVKQLSSMVADAQALLSDLGHSATERVSDRLGRRRKRGVAMPNPAGALPAERHSKAKGLTDAGRAAISAAQKRRWAQYKNKRVPK